MMRVLIGLMVQASQYTNLNARTPQRVTFEKKRAGRKVKITAP